jgi:hypothetical protein
LATLGVAIQTGYVMAEFWRWGHHDDDADNDDDDDDDDDDYDNDYDDDVTTIMIRTPSGEDEE